MVYYASGKLLLFGEYLVLKGAPCLAMPLQYGQSMKVESVQENWFDWQSKMNGVTWFSGRFSKELELIESSDSSKAEVIINLLKILRNAKKELFKTGLNFETNLNFHREWGFGTSSTLISCLSQWSGVDAFDLFQQSFDGSGYDIACANANTPVLYQMQNRQTIPVYLFPKITSKLLFIYSGNKQISSDEVLRFNQIETSKDLVQKMTQIILTAIKSTQIDDFEQAIKESEELLSQLIGLPAIKENKFADYPFAVKSLGAWGGDFFLATFRKETEALNYFRDKGYSVFFNYNQLIKK